MFQAFRSHRQARTRSNETEQDGSRFRAFWAVGHLLDGFESAGQRQAVPLVKGWLGTLRAGGATENLAQALPDAEGGVGLEVEPWLRSANCVVCCGLQAPLPFDQR